MESWWQCALWCGVQQLLFGGSCVQLCQLIWFGGIIGFVIRVCWCWALPLPVWWMWFCHFQFDGCWFLWHWVLPSSGPKILHPPTFPKSPQPTKHWVMSNCANNMTGILPQCNSKMTLSPWWPRWQKSMDLWHASFQGLGIVIFEEVDCWYGGYIVRWHQHLTRFTMSMPTATETMTVLVGIGTRHKPWEAEEGNDRKGRDVVGSYMQNGGHHHDCLLCHVGHQPSHF